MAHLDSILNDWPFDSDRLNVREAEGNDGRPVLQMRIDLGILQLEVTGRPDGERPGDEDSFFDLLVSRAAEEGSDFSLDVDDSREIDREFVQFYHRRICWLRLQRYDMAAADADHTLALMDFCQGHSDDEQWTMAHQQYRPFVLMHRTQAAAMAELEENGLDEAISAVDDGLRRLREFFVEFEMEEHYEEDEIVVQLRQFRGALREQFDDTYQLKQALDAAIAKEQYERAAEIRDEIRRKDE